MIGASGAISGVLGAYLVEFPRARVTTLLFYFVVQVPAILVLGGWFVIQFFQGVASLGAAEMEMGGVAFFAHVGGFVAGVLLIKPLALGRSPGRRGRLDWD
jgi:membrane associated rhomboid family serine protease